MRARRSRFCAFWPLSLALLVVLAILRELPLSAQTPSLAPAPSQRVWNFDSDAVGRTPAGFTAAAGTWNVAADGTGRVLEQSAASEDSVFNVVLVDDTNYADVDLSVRLKGVAGKVDQGGGVVWRARDARNYYVARFNPLEDNFRVYKVVAGKRTQMQTAKVPGDKEWHTLKITMRGSRIECFLDEKSYFAAEDNTFPSPGKIGLWCKADARTYFDDLTAFGVAAPREPAGPPPATREFEIRADRPWLGGQPIDLWGLRCGNALYSAATTERHVRNFDNMAAHGINLIGCYIQGTNAGWPNGDAGINGFTRDGRLKPDVARRLEWVIREADQRGMVVMVGVLTPRKDQEFYDDAAIRRAVEETARFLSDQRLKNVFVDLVHEFNNPERMDKELLREPGGDEKKARLTALFKALAPDIEVGICPHVNAGTADTYPGMEVRIIQKDMPIPAAGFVVNVEPLRQDYYQNDGIFSQSNRDYVFADCRKYLAAPHAVLMFHAAYIQGITNYSGTAPHPEMGGYGTGPDDRGVRFYYEWVRDHVGRWEYPKHVPAAGSSSR